LGRRTRRRPAIQNLPLLGIRTTADPGSRLAVKSDGVLLRRDDVTPGSGDMRVEAGASAKAARESTRRSLRSGFLFEFSERASLGYGCDEHPR
jgi:hypothetical protein